MGIVLALAGGCGNNNTATDGGASIDMSAAAAPTCAAYCATINANCTGNQQQYVDANTCLADCTAIPVGTAADTSGNTLGCRSYHANAAKNDPVTHCQHAGPGGAGMCGKNCEGFCQLALKWCVGANQVYANAADCMTRCMSFPDDAPVGAVTQAGSHQSCLVWHAMEAGGGSPADHCLGDIAPGDGGIKSMTCM